MGESEPKTGWPISGPSTLENLDGPAHQQPAIYQEVLGPDGEIIGIGILPITDLDDPPSFH